MYFLVFSPPNTVACVSSAARETSRKTGSALGEANDTSSEATQGAIRFIAGGAGPGREHLSTGSAARPASADPAASIPEILPAPAVHLYFCQDFDRPASDCIELHRLPEPYVLRAPILSPLRG